MAQQILQPGPVGALHTHRDFYGKRFVSRINITFDAHPPELRFASHIDTVNMEPVAGFGRCPAVGPQSLTIRVD